MANLVFKASSRCDWRASVGTGADPFPDAPARFEHRYAAHRHIAVLAIVPAQTVLRLVDGLALLGVGENLGDSFAVIGVYGAGPSPSHNLAGLLAGEGAPQRRILGYLALRVFGPDDLRTRQSQGAVTLLAKPQSVLQSGLLADVAHDRGGPHQAAAGVADWRDGDGHADPAAIFSPACGPVVADGLAAQGPCPDAGDLVGLFR